MPNREGRYGGYQPREKQNRQVRAPGSGGVRRVSPGQRPVEPQPVQRQAPRSGAGARPSPEKNNAYRAPYAPPEWAAADGWQRPPQPQRPVQTQAGQGDPARQSARSAARKARQNRRARRRLTLIATGVWHRVLSRCCCQTAVRKRKIPSLREIPLSSQHRLWRLCPMRRTQATP